MYSLNYSIKKTAKAALAGKYFGGVVAASVFVFSSLACDIVYSLIGSFISRLAALAFLCLYIVFLITPLALGLVYWSARLISVADNEPALVFNYFSTVKKYRRALAFSLPVAGISLFAGALLFLPCAVAEAVASGKLFIMLNMQIPLWAPGLWAVANAMEVAAFIIFALIMLRYYLAPFLMAADENMDPLEALHMSKIISRRSKNDFLLLALSLIGYMVLYLFMLPAVFILPYFAAVYAVFCRFAVITYNNSIDSMNKPDIPSFNADISF